MTKLGSRKFGNASVLYDSNPGANIIRMAAGIYGDGFIVVFRWGIYKNGGGKISRVDGSYTPL